MQKCRPDPSPSTLDPQVHRAQRQASGRWVLPRCTLTLPLDRSGDFFHFVETFEIEDDFFQNRTGIVFEGHWLIRPYLQELVSEKP